MAVPNGGDAVVRALRDNGVETVFGIPASYTVEIYDAILRQGGIRSIVARNEQAAAFMADGYARRSGRPGVVVVTGGPGLGNTVTGLQTAYADSSPVVVIASDHNPSQRMAQPLGLPHEAFDQAALAEATGAVVVRADDGGSIAAAVDETLQACRSGRPGPGVVLISRAALEAPASNPVSREAKPPASTPGVPDKQLDQVVRLLSAATNPVLLVGAGVVRAGAQAELADLARTTGLPVVTTVPARHTVDPASGWAGVMNNDTTRALLEHADLVIAVGTSFGIASTKHWTLRIGGSLVHVDIDPTSLGQHYQADLAIVADAASFLASLTDSLNRKGTASGRVPSADAATSSHPWTDPIGSALPSQGATICGDVTMALRWIPGDPSLGPERRLMTPWNFMTLGWAYAAALGVQAAAPDDTVLAVMGDGGALFTLGELATAVEHDLPVCLLVYNNRSYGIIAEVQDQLCEGRRFGIDLEQPDFAAVARAFGMSSSRADTPDELEAALRKHLGTGEPSLIEARLGIADLGIDSVEGGR
ncbi:MAG: thiamine pyrophosphate-binding protein [bacterium]|nr:thiamine pyrophosphate-binding protein [bacterium]MDE0290703.1 thiamine pyrophosphate-binding protein [bacterium]MDE0376910.1 thiamine pyrophosphate-binding protein [bacterium]